MSTAGSSDSPRALPKNAPWVFPSTPAAKKPDGTVWVNSHVHPATIRPDGTMYQLAAEATYTPCDITADQLAGVMRVLGCDLWIAKAQTCFGDNDALLESLAEWNQASVRAKGYGVADATTTAADIARLVSQNVCGFRFAWVGHLRASMTPEDVYRLAEKAEGSGMSFNLYFPAAEHLEKGLNLREFVGRLSKKVPVLLDHMCRPDPKHPDGVQQKDFQGVINMLDENEGRVTVLLSCPDRLVQSANPQAWKAVLPYKQILADRFPDHVLIGTDNNHPNSKGGVADDGKLWDWSLEGLSEEQRRKAACDNPLRIYWNEKAPR
jgi:2-pyrone-4,6-dicarboxylate lactonase